MESGRVPNIYWRALLFSQLRQHHTFEALPPVEAVLLADKPSYRYIRQDDPLWDRLHSGLLTTGYLAATLGFYEPECAKRLGLGRDVASYSNLLHAYHHLCGPEYHPSVNGSITAAVAAAHNVQVVAQYNAQHSKPLEDIVVKRSSSMCRKVASSLRESNNKPSTSSKKKQKKKHAKHTGGGGGFQHHPQQDGEQQQQQEEGLTDVPDAEALEVLKFKVSRAASSQGLPSVRCAWGKAQEASSLLALAAAFPASKVVECGLCALEAKDLPPDWGFVPGSLPPLGASPDGIMRHTQLQPTLLVNNNNNDNDNGDSNDGNSSGDSLPAPINEENKKEKEEAALEEQLNSLHLSNTNNTPMNGNDSTTPNSSSNGSGRCCCWEEIVEIKNTCPFGPAPRNGARPGKHRYGVSDRGTKGEVLPLWIPQLQLHMLCAGTSSGLLVSRSATKGMKIYRIPRDDEYLKLMLTLVSKFWREHVVPRQPPPKATVWRWQGHAELVQRSRSIARNAEVLGVVEESSVSSFGDDRFFLE